MCLRPATMRIPTIHISTVVLLIGAVSGQVQPVSTPLGFEASGPGFRARGAGYGIEVRHDGATLALRTDGDGFVPVSMRINEANPSADLVPERRLPGMANYLIGSDPRRWRTGVPRFGAVRAKGVRPGVDVVYYGNQRRLEYDFIFAAQTEFTQLRLRFEGLTSPPRIDAGGGLVLPVGGRELRQPPPIAYHHDGGDRTPVVASYELHRDGTVGFAVTGHDPDRELVIDPVLAYGTFLGGSSGDYVLDVCVDSAGNSYVTGYTSSPNFPTARAIRGLLTGTYDAFVAKLNPTGTTLLYSTFLGGSGSYQDHEWGASVGVDVQGQAIVFGRTNATDFPIRNASQPTIGGAYDGFVAKLTANGSALVYSTYLGGSGSDNTDARFPNSLAGGDLLVTAGGEAWLTGVTDSPNFPLRNAFQANYGGGSDAFVTKLDAVGGLVASTYLGGIRYDRGNHLVLDSSGNLVVVGSADSPGFPTTAGAYDTQGTSGGFVTKFDPNLTKIVFSSRFAGQPNSVALDGSDAIYLCGGPVSRCFPVTLGALQTEEAGRPSNYLGGDAWLSKLDAKATQLLWSTLYGFYGAREIFSDVVVDEFGHPIVALNSASGRHGNSSSCSILKFNTNGSALSYAYRIAASSGIAAVALAPNGDLIAGGSTGNSTFPTTSGAVQRVLGGSRDGWVARLRDRLTGLSALAVQTPKITRGAATVGTVTLDGRAGPAGAVVAISATPSGAVAVPATVFVVPGSSTATFAITALTKRNVGVQVTATYGGGSKTADTSVWAGPRYRIHYLGNLGSSDRAAWAYGINDLGETAGHARTPNSMHVYSHTTAGGMNDLGFAGEVEAINDLGQIAGARGYDAFLYTPGTGVRSLPLPGNSNRGGALSVNDRGEVVGWYNTNFTSAAFLWSAANGVRDIGNLGGAFASAHGINELGQVTGESYTANNVPHAFLWDPVTGSTLR